MILRGLNHQMNLKLYGSGQYVESEKLIRIRTWESGSVQIHACLTNQNM
jgi:hypothetical protein